MLCTIANAEELKLDLIINGIAPRDGSVQILDRPETLGEVKYGLDGKRVYIVVWTEPNPLLPGHEIVFTLNAGFNFYRMKETPDAHWQKSNIGEIRRV
jgi:hypothetical protein